MRILLAISGGIDSMYLANRAGDFFPGSSFAAAHCNFSLRGSESDGDEAFVREWCRNHDMDIFVRRFDTVGYASSNGISIEMAARDLRYSWFAELCRNNGFDAVAVAHNANDNAETLILNLLRGTGSKGLRGMSVESCQGNLKILRPMLDTGRDSISGWMTANGMEWREDSTNGESDVKRNVIRNEVFPIFSRINPSFIRTLNRDMVHFAQVDDIADDYYRDSGFDVSCGVDIRRLMTFSHWEYILFRLLEPYNLSIETFGKLTELLKSGRTISGKVFQSPTHIVSIRRKTLSVEERN